MQTNHCIFQGLWLLGLASLFNYTLGLVVPKVARLGSRVGSHSNQVLPTQVCTKKLHYSTLRPAFAPSVTHHHHHLLQQHHHPPVRCPSDEPLVTTDSFELHPCNTKLSELPVSNHQGGARAAHRGRSAAWTVEGRKEGSLLLVIIEIELTTEPVWRQQILIRFDPCPFILSSQ